MSCVQENWVESRLFNKDLVAKNAPKMAVSSAGGMEEEDPFTFLDELLNSDELLSHADLLKEGPNCEIVVNSP